MRRVDLAPVDAGDRHLARPARAEFGQGEADLAMHRVRGIGVLIPGFKPRLPMAVIASIDDAAQSGHILKQIDLAVLQPIFDAFGARRDADLTFSDEVQLEDLTICEDVQRGLSSGSYEPGRLNPLRENAVHHFHELLRDVYRADAD